MTTSDFGRDAAEYFAGLHYNALRGGGASSEEAARAATTAIKNYLHQSGCSANTIEDIATGLEDKLRARN
ncbi:hypothetical protein GO986_08645 [Deinococcus sp. HMF7620]|uniref:Uncharacterized protein n=1 Tax=Deinococcus arboris TaxID=2682977 RepID=A0A7C9HY05_9DEIO|nr:hypothetical protein [Deinococcus arboris]MVN86830.1 hypothetical protein [Deinococcus arboris]